jgi:hypothetical protein
MKTKILTFAALASLLPGVSAVAADMPDSTMQSKYQATDNGGYKATESNESMDANGTTMTHEATKKVDVDSHGNKTTTVDIKNSTDPKGLFNKTSTEVKNKAVEKDGKTEYSHKKTVDGHTVEKSDQTQQQSQ